MSNGTTLRPANRCRMASWRASTADCVTSASTSTCSPTSRRHARSSKNGGSTTTPTDRTRALTGLHRLSSQHAPHQGITGTDSPYKRGQVGEQVTRPPWREIFWDQKRLWLSSSWRHPLFLLARAAFSPDEGRGEAIIAIPLRKGNSAPEGVLPSHNTGSVPDPRLGKSEHPPKRVAAISRA